LSPSEAQALDKLIIVACGTSAHAALVGKFMIESLARLPVEVDYGSEFRYRDPIINGNTVVLAITQSGETVDTLAAMEEARNKGARLWAIVNVIGSQAMRVADGYILMRSGPEIGVASTKAFTCQLAVLAALAIAFGRARGVLSAEREQELVAELIAVPGLMAEAIKIEPRIEHMAQAMAKATDVLYLGRGTSYPLALEGALKLKEISYLHAEGYAAGELKHGPLALVDADMPVIAVAPNNDLLEKLKSNLQEVRARGGELYLFSDHKVAINLDHYQNLTLADIYPSTAPIVYSVPLQLLAYHVAVLKGTDVDQPRNLAKSVTVE